MSKKVNNLRKRIAKLEAMLAAEQAKPDLLDLIQGEANVKITAEDDQAYEFPKTLLREVTQDPTRGTAIFRFEATRTLLVRHPAMFGRMSKIFRQTDSVIPVGETCDEQV